MGCLKPNVNLASECLVASFQINLHLSLDMQPLPQPLTQETDRSPPLHLTGEAVPEACVATCEHQLHVEPHTLFGAVNFTSKAAHTSSEVITCLQKKKSGVPKKKKKKKKKKS